MAIKVFGKMITAALNKLRLFVKLIYNKLTKIDDTPEKIALGFSVGVFTGILPGIGPIAALAIAAFLHANKASALIGSFLTNTWISFILLIFAIKFGAFILGLSWIKVYGDWQLLIKDFHFNRILSQYKIVLSIFFGYIILGLLIAILVYLVSLMIIINRKKKTYEKII